MNQVIFTAVALADLNSLAAYVGLDSPAHAETLVARLEAATHSLGRFPFKGRARPDLNATVRSLPVGNYIIFYQVQPHAVRILHIMHAARDISTADFDP